MTTRTSTAPLAARAAAATATRLGEQGFEITAAPQDQGVPVTRVGASHSQSQPARAAAPGRLLRRFVELQVPMALGALLCLTVVTLVAASPAVAAVYRPGTHLFAAGDVVFLATPVAAWMRLRGHGWRDSLAMAVVLLAPVVAIAVAGELAALPYLGWLTYAGYPAMSLAMFAYLAAVGPRSTPNA
jgi:hypothetical protein